MDSETIDEMLERLGYEGERFSVMKRYLAEFARRKRVLEAGEITVSDIVSASLIFDGFNRGKKGK